MFQLNCVAITILLELLVLWWRRQRVEVRRLAGSARVGFTRVHDERVNAHHLASEQVALDALAAAGFGEILQVAESELVAERVDAEVAERVEAAVEGVAELAPGIEDHVVVV